MFNKARQTCSAGGNLRKIYLINNGKALLVAEGNCMCLEQQKVSLWWLNLHQEYVCDLSNIRFSC